MHIHDKGWWGEIFTLIYYMLHFYLPLKRRYKTKLGEIDLILKRGNVIVFAEVKTRKSGIHENIVTYNQQKRITNTAQIFIAQNIQYKKYNLRFDLAVIEPYKFPQIIENAW
ncbi:MAG: YraN family protein [Rickettsiaceae bacterium]|nr:YraN family protein [Rickettsiaceae bacterium]